MGEVPMHITLIYHRVWQAITANYIKTCATGVKLLIGWKANQGDPDLPSISFSYLQLCLRFRHICYNSCWIGCAVGSITSRSLGRPEWAVPEIKPRCALQPKLLQEGLCRIPPPNATESGQNELPVESACSVSKTENNSDGQGILQEKKLQLSIHDQQT